MGAGRPCLFRLKTGAVGLDVPAAVTEELLRCVVLTELLSDVPLGGESNLGLQQDEQQRGWLSFWGCVMGVMLAL